MAQEGFCATHGPYDARLGECPYCQQGGQANAGAASSPDETRIYAGSGRINREVDDLPTEVGWVRGKASSRDEEETQVFSRRRRGGAEEDVDETIMEHRLEGMLGWLIIKRGGRRGQIFRLGKESIIGRTGATIVLNDPKVSRSHAKIALRENQFLIVDILSENGTFVNGERLQVERALAENDEIRVGDTVMVLKVLPAEQE